MRNVLLSLVLTVSSVHSADWPTWRGIARDGASNESMLLNEWPKDGPERLWVSTQAGAGYSSFAVVGDRLYTMGADATTEYVIALNSQTGEKIWMQPVGERLENGWGDGPRSTPTVAGDTVVALGGQGRLVAVSADDGSVRWSVEMTDIGGSVPTWGYTESPLVDEDRILCTPGGSDGTIAAFSLTSGEKIWQSSDVTEKAQYSSIIAVDHFGQRQYIQLTLKKVFGLDIDGRLQWEADWPDGRVAVVPTPIYHNGHVYVTSSYGAGCMLLKIDADNNVEQLYANKNMKNHHGGVIRKGAHVYGYSDKVGWVCQEIMTGEIVWNEKNKLGKGALAYADGCFYCLEEQSGTCALITATAEGWQERGRFTIQPQTEQRASKGKIWSHPVIANGRLYLRDQEIICCYDVAK